MAHLLSEQPLCSPAVVAHLQLLAAPLAHHRLCAAHLPAQLPHRTHKAVSFGFLGGGGWEGVGPVLRKFGASVLFVLRPSLPNQSRNTSCFDRCLGLLLATFDQIGAEVPALRGCSTRGRGCKVWLRGRRVILGTEKQTNPRHAWCAWQTGLEESAARCVATPLMVSVLPSRLFELGTAGQGPSSRPHH